MMYKALHPRDDNDRFYVTRKGGGGGFISIEDGEDATIKGLKENTKKS